MATILTTHGLAEALGRELRAAVEAMAGRPFTTAEAAVPSGPGWGTPITASGVLDGTVTAWIDQAGVSALAVRVTGSDDVADAAVIGDLLRQLWTQAAAATTTADGFAGLSLLVGTPAAGAGPTPAIGVALLDAGQPMAVLAVAGAVTARTVLPSTPSRGQTDTAAAGGPLADHLAALLDVDLPLVVRFARTEMPLRGLAQLGPGSMVDMGRSPDAPVQLLVGAHVIAEGEVVVVGGNYGVRITSLVSAADRLRALES